MSNETENNYENTPALDYNDYNGRRVYHFMKWRNIARLISAVLLVGSIVSLAVNGLQFGLDFTGGTQVEVEYETPPSIGEIRSQLEGAGYKGAVVVLFGSDKDILIKLPPEVAEAQAQTRAREGTSSIGDEVVKVLKSHTTEEIELRRVEMVGPQVGEELRDDGGLGMLFALGVVMFYVAVRFQFKFSVGAVAALAHDVIIVLGFFSFFKLDFDLTVLAAILAVVGYSLNDTIVVSDRIRENFRKVRKATPEEIIDISLSETLGRTLMTSITTMLVLLALFVFGGELIHNFSTALMVGVGVGTYSSIYVAASILLAMDISKEDLMPPVKEGAELDDMP